MKNRNFKRRNLQAYDRKSGNLEKRLENDYIDHGIATIPCKIRGIDDIISPYSVKGYESVNSEFVEYVNSIAKHIPEEYPIVLSITGEQFTKDVQERIESIIKDDYAYNLGAVEKENKYHLRVFWRMIAGVVISSIMITVFNWWTTIPMELLFVFFWFFADTFVYYLLLEGRNLRKQRLKAAQLACLKIVFSEEYDEQDYSEEEAERIFDEVYHKV